MNRALLWLGILAFPRLALAEAPEAPESIQYGAGIVAGTFISDHALCPAGSPVPCVLGGGGGALLRAGLRSRSGWYLGGAYAVTRHDSSDLLVLPLLNQMRGEARYRVFENRLFRPQVQLGAGAAFYGSEFRADTWAFLASVGVGAEIEAARGLLFVPTISYSPFLWAGYTDSAAQVRAGGPGNFGLSHFWGVEVTIELLSPRPRWER